MATSMPPSPLHRTAVRTAVPRRRSFGGTLVASALVTAFALQAGTGAADDTEVYFGQPDPNADTNPNVLFVLDTSGSMGRVDENGITRLNAMKTAVKDMLRQANALNVGLMKFNSFDGGGPIIFPVTNLDKEVCEGVDCDGLQASASVASDADDVEEYVSDGNDVLTTGTVLEIIDTNRGKQEIGLRFTDLAIPNGATILDARLDLMAERDASGGEVTIDIRTENSGDSEPFSGADRSVSSRPWHVSKTSWKIDEDWEKGQIYSSENLAGIIRLVTGRSDWCGGNALALRLQHSRFTTASGIRRALTFRSATAIDSGGSAVGQPATLRITYEPAAASTGSGCQRTSTSSSVADGDDDAEQYLDNKNSMLVNGSILDMPVAGNGTQQQIGVRFPDIRVPQGATVRRAWIEFHVYGQATGWRAADVSVRISGQSANDAARFKGKRNDIGKRARTGASVIWDLPNEPAGSTVKTDDVGSVVQEIVSRNGWSEGNAMAFIVTQSAGSGSRKFTTYDESRADAARLVIEYDDDDGGLASTGDTRTFLVRDELIALVDTLVAAGGTPIVDSMWEATQYFRGGDVQFGKRRGSRNQNTNRVSHPDSHTGGTLYRPSDCSEDNLNSSNCNGERIDGAPVYTTPITGSCQTNHIVLLSDGAAVSNSSKARIRDLARVGTCEGSGDEECGTELAQWLYENDVSSGVVNRQNVKTHTIAFDLDNPTFLQDLAREGGGKLYEADDAATLLSAFRRIISGANATETSFASPGATVNQFNRLTHRDDIYFAMFKPTGDPRWSGNLKKFRIGARKAVAGSAGTSTEDGEVVVRDRNDDPAMDEATGYFSDQAFSFWEEDDEESSGGLLGGLLGGGSSEPSPQTPDGHDVTRGGAANQIELEGLARIGNRRTYTWTGSAASVPTDGIDLTLGAQALHEDNQAIDEAMLAIGGVSDDARTRDDYRTTLLGWARGVDVQDDDGDGSRTDSRHHMGDPMHTRPVLLNYADTTSDEDIRSIVFTATNEGYLHAIDTSNGEEQFAYMPGELLRNLHPQFDNGADSRHVYGLDGPLSLWRSDANANLVVDPGEEAYVFAGMRRGGSGYYALDVSELDRPRLAWAIEAGSAGFEQLGQSWSRMAPVRMAIDGVDEDVLLFGGGYDEAQDSAQAFTDNSYNPSVGSVEQFGRGLYIVRARTGKLLWSGLGGSGGSQSFPDMRHPMPGNLRAVDINGDGLVNQIYAADTGGQVWRFDLKAGHTSADGDLMQGGVIADLSGRSTAHQRRFYAEPDVALVERGGESYLTVGIGSGWRAHPLDEKVDDRFYVLRQKNFRNTPVAGEYGIEDDGYHRPLTDADLTSVTDELDPVVGEHGWYIDLVRSGEKVLGTSVTFDNSILFSSYIPDESVNDCAAGVGGGRAYVLDLLTGAPRQDLDEDGTLEIEDRSIALKHEGLPPDAMIMITETDAHGTDEEGGPGSNGDIRVVPTVLLGVEQFDAGLSAGGRRTFWSDRSGDEPILSAEGED